MRPDFQPHRAILLGATSSLLLMATTLQAQNAKRDSAQSMTKVVVTGVTKCSRRQRAQGD
jgi:hypothetical protein